MRKTKRSNKLLSLFTIVVVVLSLFALGASAITEEEYNALEIQECCTAVTPLTADELESMINYEQETITFTCPTCGRTLEYFLVEESGIELEPEHKEYGYSYAIIFDGFGTFTIYYYDADGNDAEGGGYYYDSVVDHGYPETNNGMVGTMVGTITTGLGGTLSGIGSSIVTFFDNTVLDADGNLTTFATWALAFLGIAFALGVTKFITAIVRR